MHEVRFVNNTNDNGLENRQCHLKCIAFFIYEKNNVVKQKLFHFLCVRFVRFKLEFT